MISNISSGKAMFDNLNKIKTYRNDNIFTKPQNLGMPNLNNIFIDSKVTNSIKESVKPAQHKSIGQKVKNFISNAAKKLPSVGDMAMKYIENFARGLEGFEKANPFKLK